MCKSRTSHNSYLKTATLLVGVFWLWDWGHEGSETLSPDAFAQAAYSAVAGADGATCGAIRDSIRRIAIENRFFLEYVAGEILIFLDDDDDEISAAIFAANQAAETVTGIASFDSLSSVYGLIAIYSRPESSRWYKRGFVLIFPAEADLVPIVLAYEDLPYMEWAELNNAYYVYPMKTVINIPPEFPSEEPDIWDHAYAAWEVEILLKENDEIRAAIFAASQVAEPVTGIASFDSLSSAYGLICLHSIGESSRFYKRQFTLIFPLEAAFGNFWPLLSAYHNLPYIERVTFGQYRPLPAEPSALLEHSWGRIKAYQRK